MATQSADAASGTATDTEDGVVEAGATGVRESDDRPRPGPRTDSATDDDSGPSDSDDSGTSDSETSDSGTSDSAGSESAEESEAQSESAEDKGDGKPHLDRDDETQDFVDQSVIDFDPDDGVYSGTVVSGETEIEGPHIGEDGTVDEEESKKFLEDGKEQAKKDGLLDEDGNPTDKVEDAKGSGETGETGDEGTEDRE